MQSAMCAVGSTEAVQAAAAQGAGLRAGELTPRVEGLENCRHRDVAHFALDLLDLKVVAHKKRQGCHTDDISDDTKAC